VLAMLAVLPAVLTTRLVGIDLHANAITHAQAVLFYKANFLTRDGIDLRSFSDGWLGL
jgi:hypothetical protein